MRPTTWLVLTCVLSACGTAFAGKKPVTAEVAASPPSARGMTNIRWAPNGKRFACLDNDTFCIYDVVSRRQKSLVNKKVLTTLAVAPPEPERFHWRNRRVREERIQWFPAGDRLLVKVKGDLFIVETGSGQWKQLTATGEDEADPRLSPDGRYVSFRRGNELYVLSLSSGKVRRLTHDATAIRWNGKLDWVYPEELDLGQAQWWSPDSRRLAYLQFDVSREMIYPHADLLGLRAIYEPQRYPQAGTPNADVRLGIVSARGGRTRWIETVSGESELLARVTWLPGGSAVAVEKLDRIQKHLQLEIVPVRGGGIRTLLEETDPYWINISDDLTFFKKSPRLIWSSERSGFRHLYLYTIEGELVRRLTQGDWEVSRLAGLDEASQTVYYVSTEAGPLERHLYSVKLDGAGHTRLTKEAGTHSITMSPVCDYYIDTWSNCTTPPSRILCDPTGARLAVVEKADTSVTEKYEILPSEILSVAAADGARLYAKLIRPAGFEPGTKYPAVVMVYGGPHVQTVRNSWQGAGLQQALAQAGFVVWQLDNRGSFGCGHRWEAKIYRRLGKQELEDQLAGVHHLISMGFVDPKRIGIHGWSYGGFMTLYSLLHAPKTFRAGVAGAPVTDFRNYDTIYTERYMGLPEGNKEGYRRSAVVNAADRLEADLLLIHNFEDDNVLFQNTLQMAHAFEEAGKPFEMMLYPQKTHGVTGDARKHLYQTIIRYFEQKLRGQ